MQAKIRDELESEHLEILTVIHTSVKEGIKKQKHSIKKCEERKKSGWEGLILTYL